MTTFRGLATIRYHADSLDAARAWYSEVLGVERYFVSDEYIEFRLGDHLQEFGISRTPSAPAGVVAYWHVDEVDAVMARLLKLGAKEHEPLRDYGDFRAGAVLDPFGNILGVMHNPHYAQVLGESGRAASGS
ncbi:VOC family protein [Streptomyces sp. NRRL S-337]|uniref:VOC family protein n=1 Tax=Streptomyces sp. NRRL S-337 TaxID=1463900 RepID=UPI0004CB550E|nr:VOC family protein [Streptomyces sp. NRRL S-337]